MTTVTIKNTEHCVYDSIEEFRKYSDEPIVRPWDKAEKGDWVLADDGGVCQILRKGPYYDSHYVGTAIGTFKCNGTMSMDTDLSKHEYRYTFSGRNPFKVRLRSNDKLRGKEKKFISLVALGFVPEAAFEKTYGRKPDSEFTRTKMINILAKKEGREIMSKVAQDAAEEVGVKLSTIIKRMDDRARQKDDIKTAQKADETLGKWMGAEESDQPITGYAILGQKIVGELDDEKHKQLSDGTEDKEIHGGSETEVLQGEPQQEDGSSDEQGT